MDIIAQQRKQGTQQQQNHSQSNLHIQKNWGELLRPAINQKLLSN